MLVPSLRRFGLIGLAVGLISASSIAQETKEKTPSTVVPASKSNEGWWMKRHENFVERTRKGSIDLLLIGDSITQGWEHRDPKTGKGPAEVWERHYAPRNAANLGIGGDRTEHVLWRLDHDEVDGIKPKLAVVMIGTNNLGANTNDEIAQGIKAVVAKLHDKLPDTKVLLLGIFPRGQAPTDKARDRIKAINEQISKLDDGKVVKYKDIGEKFLESDGSISKEIMPDFLHLTKKGYQIWADAIEPTVWEMMDAK